MSSVDEVASDKEKEIVSDTILVSNLCEDVTILQLIEHFGMIGNVKVHTFQQPWQNYNNRKIASFCLKYICIR